MKPLPEGLVVRPAERADDDQMRAVLAASFPTNPKTRPEITAWQWWDNPFGETIAFVCTDPAGGDRVVSQMAAVCLPATFGGVPATLAIGVDLATSPDHRGRGLARHLIHATFGAAMARRLPVYLFPNESSTQPLRDGGWVPVTPLDVRVLPTDPDAVLDLVPPRLSRLEAVAAPLVTAGQRALRARTRARRGAADRSVEVACTPPDGIDGLWRRVAHQHPWGVARHGDWWQWRYGDRPGDDYRLVSVRSGQRLTGVAAVSTRDDLGAATGRRFHCILDLLADEEDDARALVAAIVDGALDGDGAVDGDGGTAPVAGVATMGVPGSRLSHLAGSAGLLRVPNRLLPRPSTFGVVPSPTTLANPRGLDWATAWGDVDHV